LLDECTDNNHWLDLPPIDRLPTFASPGELAQLVEYLHGMQSIRRLKKLEKIKMSIFKIKQVFLSPFIVNIKIKSISYI